MLKEVAYDCDADMDHPCGSIFCSHGAGYYAVSYTHLMELGEDFCPHTAYMAPIMKAMKEADLLIFTTPT